MIGFEFQFQVQFFQLIVAILQIGGGFDIGGETKIVIGQFLQIDQNGMLNRLIVLEESNMMVVVMNMHCRSLT